MIDKTITNIINHLQTVKISLKNIFNIPNIVIASIFLVNENNYVNNWITCQHLLLNNFNVFLTHK